MPEGTGEAAQVPANPLTGEPAAPTQPTQEPQGEGGQQPIAPEGGAQPQHQAGGGEPRWFDSVEDESVRGWISNKNFKSAEALARSAYNLEKHLGVPEDRLVTLPSDPNDQEAWQAVHRKLGAPETPEGYELPEDVAWLGEVAHKQGVRPEALSSLVEAYNERAEAAKAEHAQKAQQEREQALSQLKAEWGNAYDDRIEAGSRVIEKMGIDAEMADAIRSQVGARAFIEKMVEIGLSTQEGRMVEGSPTAAGKNMAMTPAQAKDALRAMEGDPGWLARYDSKDDAVRQAALRERAEITRHIR